MAARSREQEPEPAQHDDPRDEEPDRSRHAEKRHRVEQVRERRHHEVQQRTRQVGVAGGGAGDGVDDGGKRGERAGEHQNRDGEGERVATQVVHL